MLLSASSMFFHDLKLKEIFSSVSEAGTDTLEFWLETPDFWVPGLHIESLDSLLSASPFSYPIAVHAPVLDLNPCSINPDVRMVSIEWAMRSIRMADHLGASVCTIHPGKRTARRPPSKTDYQRLYYLLDSLTPVAERSAVSVSLENMEPQVNALLTTPKEIEHLLDRYDWLSFTLDVCHVSSQGHQVLSEYLQAGEGRIANIHISGSSGRILHQPVKNDSFATKALYMIGDSAYSGLMTIEINDLVLSGPVTREKKIQILADDLDYIRKILGDP